MTRRMFPLVVVTMLLAAPGAQAQERQQIMAELRMLQEQQAQLQLLLAGLADTLKTMTAKLEEQTGATRKAFADQKLIVDNVAEGVRILREKSDDTNVRLGTMAQELEALRATVQAMPAPQMVPSGDPNDPNAPPQTGVTPPPAAPLGGVSPARAYDSAFNDYTGGQWDLAVSGFELYVKSFPTSPLADDAQLNIGNSYFAMGNYKAAVTALQKVIADYPQADSVPQAYYKLGQTYEALKQVELARTAYETLLKQFPDDRMYASLGRQRLDSLTKKD
jgi:tol-pal system protein YbgF